MFKHIGTVGMIFVLLLASVSGAVTAYEPDELSVDFSEDPNVSENVTVSYDEEKGEVVAEYDGALASEWDEVGLYVEQYVNGEVLSETFEVEVIDPEGGSLAVDIDDEATSFVVSFEVENVETNEGAVVDFEIYELEVDDGADDGADDGDSGGLFDGDDNTTLYVVVGVVAGLLLFLSRP